MFVNIQFNIHINSFRMHVDYIIGIQNKEIFESIILRIIIIEEKDANNTNLLFPSLISTF